MSYGRISLSSPAVIVRWIAFLLALGLGLAALVFLYGMIRAWVSGEIVYSDGFREVLTIHAVRESDPRLFMQGIYHFAFRFLSCAVISLICFVFFRKLRW